MTSFVGLKRCGLGLLACLVLSSCMPSAPRDEEKEPHFLAGRSRVNTRDFKGAIDSFEKALEVNPRSGLAHFELGCLFDQKEPDPAAAIYHYEKYLKLCPDSGKEDIVRPRIMACKQQLAQAVSLAPGLDKQQQELDQLAEENQRLRDELEKWRVQAGQSQTSSPASPGVRPAASGGSGVSALAASSRPLATATASPRTHTVRAGETLYVIARKYGLKLDALTAANPRLDPRRMRPGQTLVIP